MLPEHLLNAPVRHRGRYYEEFEPGRVFTHPFGRTVDHYDSLQFTLATAHYNPVYFDGRAAAKAGHRTMPVNPYFVFCTVLGLSVEDLSEMGGAFLGLEQLQFLAFVYPGDTLTARSTVLSRRPSSKTPDSGVVTWLTEGFNQSDVKVVEYQRSNMVPLEGGAA
ncbi:MAG: MaoC family dehydratase [Burkholderiaceae bacterium]|nr:MaoC family dehydratase [Burkholderiaceae bacterium]